MLLLLLLTVATFYLFILGIDKGYRSDSERNGECPNKGIFPRQYFFKFWIRFSVEMINKSTSLYFDTRLFCKYIKNITIRLMLFIGKVHSGIYGCFQAKWNEIFTAFPSPLALTMQYLKLIFTQFSSNGCWIEEPISFLKKKNEETKEMNVIKNWTKLKEFVSFVWLLHANRWFPSEGEKKQKKRQVNSIRSNIYWFLIDFHRILWSKSSIIYVTEQKKKTKKNP